jgi:TPR repeat protein
VNWYREAAVRGIVDAQYALAVMYDYGEGIARNDLQAMNWYRRAADKGHRESQYKLGLKYDLGEGVIEDDVQAYKWITLSANQGSAKAKDGQYILKKELTLNQLAEAEKLVADWYSERD